jgi:hypothetical protein
LKRWMIVVGILMALPVLWILGGTWLAARRERAAERAWAEIGLPIDGLAARFPKTIPSKAALEIEAAAARMGMDVAPHGDTSRVHPGKDVAKRFNDLGVGTFVDAQRDRADDVVKALPVALSLFLTSHAADIEAVRAASAGELIWESDIAQLFAAPIPSIKGHRDLQAVLALDALDKVGRGDSAGALASLAAGWRIASAFARRPELISQIFTINLDRQVLGIVRKVPVVPDEWRARLRERDYAKTLLTALQVEGWMVTTYARTGTTGTAAVLAPLERPYLRLSGANHADIMRRLVADLKKEDPCTMDVSAFDNRVRSWVPRWNVLSAMALPNLGGHWRLAARSAVDAELSQKIVEARSTPPTADVSSSICSVLTWKPQVSGDALSLTASTNPFGEKSPGLPLSFTMHRVSL